MVNNTGTIGKTQGVNSVNSPAPNTVNKPRVIQRIRARTAPNGFMQTVGPPSSIQPFG